MRSNIKISAFSLILLAGTAAFAQKGIDTQTQTIRDANTGGNKGSKATRTIDFGKDKTHVRERLANPYKFLSKRDILIRNISEVLKGQKIILDEAASRSSDGLIITQPYQFARGAVLSTQELNRYGIIPSTDSNWTRGRYTLTIEINSVDGMNHNVSVTARVEGRTENPLGAEWLTFKSSGAAEEEFLVKLVEAVTGVSPDDPKPEDLPGGNK
jgi:hypothetical protein